MSFLFQVRKVSQWWYSKKGQVHIQTYLKNHKLMCVCVCMSVYLCTNVCFCVSMCVSLWVFGFYVCILVYLIVFLFCVLYWNKVLLHIAQDIEADIFNISTLPSLLHLSIYPSIYLDLSALPSLYQYFYISLLQ